MGIEVSGVSRFGFRDFWIRYSSFERRDAPYTRDGEGLPGLPLGVAARKLVEEVPEVRHLPKTQVKS